MATLRGHLVAVGREIREDPLPAVSVAGGMVMQDEIRLSSSPRLLEVTIALSVLAISAAGAWASHRREVHDTGELDGRSEAS